MCWHFQLLFLNITLGQILTLNLGTLNHMERTGSRVFSIITIKQGVLFAKWVMIKLTQRTCPSTDFIAYGKFKNDSVPVEQSLRQRRRFAEHHLSVDASASPTWLFSRAQSLSRALPQNRGWSGLLFPDTKPCPVPCLTPTEPESLGGDFLPPWS